ncbi:MFS transporter [Phreatobacter aquaticus]|uniref:MFS transporter n=1 Tax=Phreatobacter aquaticus TaxID=2570229 RepID=A0A4D7QP16_9HYPH|nr:MFS transporter [Phreatobacter aquaticus]QCK87024.1 MFS transporter [Phreatobacter aquaticus]
MSSEPVAPPLAPEPPTRGFIDTLARSEFIRLGIILFLTAMTNQQAVLLAVIWEHVGFSHANIGILLAIYGVPLVVMSFLSGAVANRIGLIATMKLGCALTTFGLASLYVTHDSFAGSLASRLIQGCGFALFHAPTMTYGTTRLTQARFIQLFGILSAMAPLPYAFAPVLAEAIFHTFGPSVFFLIGSLPGLIALPMLFTLRQVEKAGPEVGGMRALFKAGRIVLPMIAAVVYGGMFGFVAAYMAPVLIDRGMSIGVFFTSFTLSIFVVRLGLLSPLERVDRRLVVAGGAVILGAGMIMAAFAQSVPMAVLAGAVFGLGHSIGFPVLSAWICDGIPPERRATPLALFNATFFAAIYMIALPASVAIEAAGYVPVMIAIGASGFVLAVGMVLVWAKRFD